MKAIAAILFLSCSEYGELVPDQFTLHPVDPDEEKHLVAWAHLSSFRPK